MKAMTSCSVGSSRSTASFADRRSGHREPASVHLRGRDGYPPGPSMSVPAREAEPLSLDEVKEQLVAKGRERGFVTSEDLLEAVPVDDFTQEQVEEFLTQVQEHLTAESVEVIEVPGDDTDAATQVRMEVALSRAPGTSSMPPRRCASTSICCARRRTIRCACTSRRSARSRS